MPPKSDCRVAGVIEVGFPQPQPQPQPLLSARLRVDGWPNFGGKGQLLVGATERERGPEVEQASGSHLHRE